MRVYARGEGCAGVRARDGARATSLRAGRRRRLESASASDRSRWRGGEEQSPSYARASGEADEGAGHLTSFPKRAEKEQGGGEAQGHRRGAGRCRSCARAERRRIRTISGCGRNGVSTPGRRGSSQVVINAAQPLRAPPGRQAEYRPRERGAAGEPPHKGGSSGEGFRTSKRARGLPASYRGV